LVIRSIRRECTDHLIVFSEKHLRRILAKYTTYYNKVRTHVSLGKDAPFTGVRLPTLIEILNGSPPANSSPIRVEWPPGQDFRYSGGGIMVLRANASVASENWIRRRDGGYSG
jgi:Integrase core domain